MPKDTLPRDLRYRMTDYPPPRRPSRHRPGSPGKIADMAARLRAGRHLHHPDDPRHDPGGAGVPTASPDAPVRIPLFSTGNFKPAGEVAMSEREYRALGRVEPWWEEPAETVEDWIELPWSRADWH